MADAELRVLGSVTLVADLETVPLGGARQRAIVAYLALANGRPVPIPRLIEDVWGSAAPRTVVKSLSTLASRLRHALSPHGFELRFDETGYALHLPAGGFDLDRFRMEVGLARVCELEGDTPGAITHLRAALATWRGEPLDGLVAPFVDQAAADLLVEREDIEDELARQLLDSGAGDAAVDLFEGLVARDPFREDRWAALVGAYSAAGRRADALEVYQRARRTLLDELGTEPGEELRAAERAAMTDAPPARAPARPATAAPTRVPSKPIVAEGRTAELAILEEEARAAAMGTMRGVVITGEPGVGKSHLVKAFIQDLTERGVLVASARCDPFGSVPLGPLLSLIEQSNDFGTLDAAMLANEAPVLLDVLSGKVLDHPIGDAGDLRRNALLRELRLVMRKFSVPRPYAVVIEDFHWVDPLTEAAFQFMAEEQATAPVLFIVTAREPDLSRSSAGRMLDELTERHALRRIRVGPLDRAALRPVVADALSAADDPEALLDLITQGSGGNPLYARQLARHLAAAADSERLPDDLRHLMQARIRSIDEEARELLVLGSVLGMSFDLGEVGTVFPDDAAGIARRADVARTAGLLEDDDEPGRLRFVHGLIRQAAYELADPHQQALLHFAAAMILGYGSRPADAEMVRHLLRARPVVPHEDIARAVLDAAGLALVIGAHESAEQLVRAAMDLEIPPELRAELHLFLGAALVSAGENRGIAQLDIAHAQARELGRWDIVADCLMARSRIARLFSINEARLRADEITEVLAVSAIGRRRRARLLCVQADALLIVDPAAALQAIEAAETMAPKIDRPELDHHLAHLRLRHRFATGAHPDKVAAEALRMVERAAEAGDLIAAAHSGAVAQHARVVAGRLEECVADQDRLATMAQSSGRVDLAYQIRSAAVSASIVMEPLGVADQASELLSNESAGAGTTLSGATRLMHLWLLRREQRRLDEVTWFFETVVNALDRPEADAWVAACRMEVGRLDEARALLEPLPTRMLTTKGDWSRPAMLAVVTDLAFDLGVPIDARRFAAGLRPLAGQMVVAAGWVQILGRADRYLGRLAQLRGDLPGAIEHFTTARHLDQASGAHLWAGWAAHDEARARLEREGPGDRAVAEALLDGSLRTAKRLGARRLASSIRDTLATP